MDAMILADPAAATLVVGGTIAATLLRCGWHESRDALMAIAQCFRRSFDADRARAELAVQIQDINRDGLLRAQPHHFGDREFDDMTDALIGRRSLGALLERHESHKADRLGHSERATATLMAAAELAPIFGLIGTLVSLSQLPTGQGSSDGFAAAISLSVVTTLYGVLSANILFAPLARLIERRSVAEEGARQRLIDWLASQVADECRRPKIAATHGVEIAA